MEVVIVRGVEKDEYLSSVIVDRYFVGGYLQGSGF